MLFIIFLTSLLANGDVLGKENHLSDDRSEINMIKLLKSYDELLSEIEGEKTSRYVVKDKRRKGVEELSSGGYIEKGVNDAAKSKYDLYRDWLMKNNKKSSELEKRQTKKLKHGNSRFSTDLDNDLKEFQPKRSKVNGNNVRVLKSDHIIPPPPEWMTGKKDRKQITADKRKSRIHDSADKTHEVKEFASKPVRSWVREKRTHKDYDNLSSRSSSSERPWRKENQENIREDKRVSTNINDLIREEKLRHRNSNINDLIREEKARREAIESMRRKAFNKNRYKIHGGMSDETRKRKLFEKKELGVFDDNGNEISDSMTNDAQIADMISGVKNE